LKLLVAVGVALALLSVPVGSAAYEDLRAPNEVVAYRTADGHVVLAWNPALGATHYVVWRGTQPGQLAQVHDGPLPGFYDTAALPHGVTIYYVIAAIDPYGNAHSTSFETRADEDCVSVASSLSFSVSLGNCLTIIPEL
jgi:hypothetical protein